MSATLKVAIVGTVGHLNYVLTGLEARKDNCRLVAVATGQEDDRLQVILDSPVGRNHSPKVYEDYRRMLDEAKPDIVCVFMRYHRNAEVATAAAQHGCHVVAEKPIATEPEDLERLREAVQRSNVRLTTLLAMRYEPHFYAARKAVEKGMIGEPILAFGQKSYKFGTRPDWYKERRTYGGTILWVAIHAIDFVRFVTGLEYTSVTAAHVNKAHPDYPDCEDAGALLFKLSNGGQAVITFDYLRPQGAHTHGDDRLRVAGSEGVLEVRAAEDICQVITRDRPILDLPRGEEKNIFVDFVDDLLGRAQHLIGPEEPFRITEVALKARLAADTGQTIPL